MPGFEKHRFVNLSETDSDEFTCGICLEILKKPTVVPCCRQTYCSECINQWLNNKNCCPNDRHVLIQSQLYEAQRLVINLMTKLQIRCTFCPSVLDLQCLQTHENQCLYNPDRRCSGCGLSVGQSSQQHNCVNSLKSLNNCLSKELSELKSEIVRLREELKSLRDNNVLSNQSDHIHQVMASARTRISYPEITYCSIPSALRHKAIVKSKEAILAFDSYLQISQFLNTEINSCDNCEQKWYITVHSLQCGEALIRNQNGYIDLRFGRLRIAIFSAGARLTSSTTLNSTSITLNSNSDNKI